MPQFTEASSSNKPLPLIQPQLLMRSQPADGPTEADIPRKATPTRSLPVVETKRPKDVGRVGLDLVAPETEDLATSLPTKPTDSEPTESQTFEGWPRPVSLSLMLDEVEPDNAQVAQWTSAIQHQIDGITQFPIDDARMSNYLDQLLRAASKLDSLEVYCTDQKRILLRRIRYGIERRVDVWRHANQLAIEQAARPLIVDVIRAVSVLRAVDERLSQHPYQAAWRNYLLLDKLNQIAMETWVLDATVRRQTARQVLDRMEAEDLTPEQQQILTHQVFGTLRARLLEWADEEIDTRTFLRTLEQYEATRNAALAERLRSDMESMAYCRYTSAQPLRFALNRHYRNANVRVTVAGRLMNDLLPVLKPIRQPIRDNILGADVIGQNQTWADLNLQLVDDPNQLHLSIQANGTSRSSHRFIQGARPIP